MAPRIYAEQLVLRVAVVLLPLLEVVLLLHPLVPLSQLSLLLLLHPLVPLSQLGFWIQGLPFM
jgi:hypothetical protein